MIIGVPREIKDEEYRVALTPPWARMLAQEGHRVLVERGAGQGSSFSDAEYQAAGATIVESAEAIYGQADLVVKVKEPLPREYPLLRPRSLLFGFLHLAVAPELAQVLLEKEINAIAYETVQLQDGSLPLLAPMSEVAGRLAAQIGAHYLERPQGGRGLLLGGLPGVAPGQVVVLGGGIAGTGAAVVARGLGAQVTVIDINVERLRTLRDRFDGAITTLISAPHTIAEAVAKADLLIGAVLIPGALAPHLVTREMIATMRPGSVVLDISVDQGGCVETTRPTTHRAPTYVVNGVVHYGVTNMPAAVPHTSTQALCNATVPYLRKLAALGFIRAIAADETLAKGVNACAGHLTHHGVAEALNLPYTPLERLVSPLPASQP